MFVLRFTESSSVGPFRRQPPKSILIIKTVFQRHRLQEGIRAPLTIQLVPGRKKVLDLIQEIMTDLLSLEECAIDRLGMVLQNDSLRHES